MNFIRAPSVNGAVSNGAAALLSHALYRLTLDLSVFHHESAGLLSLRRAVRSVLAVSERRISRRNLRPKPGVYTATHHNPDTTAVPGTGWWARAAGTLRARAERRRTKAPQAPHPQPVFVNHQPRHSPTVAALYTALRRAIRNGGASPGRLDTTAVELRDLLCPPDGISGLDDETRTIHAHQMITAAITSLGNQDTKALMILLALAPGTRALKLTRRRELVADIYNLQAPTFERHYEQPLTRDLAYRLHHIATQLDSDYSASEW
jgi:hypothetical protein